MKIRLMLLPLAALIGGLAAGCGHLDLVPQGDPQRVATGTVQFPDGTVLPPDTVVQVRVIDATRFDIPPQIIGEQSVSNPGQPPVAFRVEYTAEDELLRKGLHLEVRVSFRGRIQFSNLDGTLLTSSDVDSPHEIWVQRM